MINSNKNRACVTYVAMLAVLLQLFSPTIFALTTDFKQSGKVLAVCTMQGYKQVWIVPDDEQGDANSTNLNCPCCLLNIGALDLINTNVEYYFDFVDEYVYSSIVIQNNIQSKILLNSLAIRAPPYFELMS